MRTMFRRPATVRRLVRPSEYDSFRVPDALFAAHPNLLVVGPVARASQILPWQFFREPITRCCADATPLALPATGGGTFVLLRVDILSTPGQLALLQWIEREGAHTQIVSLAERNLFPLVESGAFRDDLYYRLNTVYLEARRSIETAARASLRG